MWRYGLAWSQRLALVALKLTEERAECTRQQEMFIFEKGARGKKKLENNGLIVSRVQGIPKTDKTRIEEKRRVDSTGAALGLSTP